MKGCLGFVVIAAAAAGGGYAVYANPTLPAQATHFVQQAADWTHSDVAVPPATAPLRSGVQTDLPPSIPPSEPSWPIVLTAPRTGSSPAPGPPWSSADCSWAASTLTEDRQLDEAAAIANGTDSRYGSGPDVVAYYEGYADEWQTVLGEVQDACVTGSSPTQAQASDALFWFASATAAHQDDAEIRPGDTSWDALWIGNYRPLSTMFAASS